MVNEQQLSAVLAELARTLITDFPIQGILDQLVERIVEVLPVTAAGVTLISPGMTPHFVAASNAAALRFEQLQTELGQGPCVLAYEDGEIVAVPDLREDDRFPAFSPAALAAGMTAVFTFPLRQGDGRLGALDIYRDTPGEMEPRDLAAAQTLADVASAYLLNAQARDRAREAADRFRHNALHDPLTGLPNRALLQQRLEHAAQRAQRSHSNAAILFADLDDFKRVNDTYGHQAGDDLLVAVAHRLAGLVRPGDTLARVSGDEFVFLCEDLHSASDVEILATRLHKALAIPFVLADLSISISASVGMAYAGPGEDITNQLMVDADIAMYQAKRKGGGSHRIVDLRESRQSGERHSLDRDLRLAFSHEKLDVAYQPIVRSSDGLVTGAEALLRWTHPDRGPVPTVAMVGLAEQNGLITDIGAWVLERSCIDRQQWLRDYPESPLDVAVNVSAGQLTGPDFCATVTSVLQRTGMDPKALVLEVTEGIFIVDAERAVAVLSDLRMMGVRLALDDFGTGYSSLRYLRRLPVDIVKIDQSFVGDIGRDPAGVAIVEAVTNLAHVLGLSVTAEGVETAEQREKVIAIGCESAQGFLYARPMPARQLADWLDGTPGGALHLPGRETSAGGLPLARRLG